MKRYSFPYNFSLKNATNSNLRFFQFLSTFLLDPPTNLLPLHSRNRDEYRVRIISTVCPTLDTPPEVCPVNAGIATLPFSEQYVTKLLSSVHTVHYVRFNFTDTNYAISGARIETTLDGRAFTHVENVRPQNNTLSLSNQTAGFKYHAMIQFC
ncbi:unnamed protein product [Echinostoma caproni]|uniref:F5/8 type C domain-containing protein n=1 Tax=Echinostoma caproni TaxID=27848 RepID=A0A183A3L3_9TREM|nr:unnamed protein product [Echinostoma caproni]